MSYVSHIIMTKPKPPEEASKDVSFLLDPVIIRACEALYFRKMLFTYELHTNFLYEKRMYFYYDAL